MMSGIVREEVGEGAISGAIRLALKGAARATA